MDLLGLTQERFQEHVAAIKADGGNPGNVYWSPVTQDQMYRVLAHAVPNRFSHWTFGQEYLGLKQGGGRVYEFVVWDDPAEAYIDQTLSTAEADLIAIHVLAHADFFINNFRYQWEPPHPQTWQTHADWVDKHVHALSREVREFAGRISARQAREPMVKVGESTTGVLWEFRPMIGLLDNYSAFDLMLALEPAVKPSWERKPQALVLDAPEAEGTSAGDWASWRLWRGESLYTPEPPLEDAALVRMNRKAWNQVDVLDVVRTTARSNLVRQAARWLREEWEYFWTLKSTKLMNEGWASYWHRKQTANPLSENWAWQQAHLRVGVEVPRVSNPYWLGAELFRLLEEEGEHPREWMTRCDDQTFLGMALTPERAQKLRLVPIWTETTRDEWVIRRDRDLEDLAFRYQHWWEAQMHGGIGRPILEWTSPRTLQIQSLWGAMLIDKPSAHPIDPWWFLGLATLLGRSITVDVQKPWTMQTFDVEEGANNS